MAATPLSKPIAVAAVDYGPRQSYRYMRYGHKNTNTTNTQLLLRSTTKPFRTESKTPNNSNWRDRLCSNGSSSTSTSSITDILRLMDSLCIPISPDIYASLIKECAIARDSHVALELHRHIKNSPIKPGLSLLNRLLLMHASCGHVRFARPLFDQMPLKDFNSWAIMILGYVRIDDHEETTALFVKMQLQQTHKSHVLKFPTWIIVCILKSCMLTMNLDLGKQIHGLLLKFGRSNDLSITATLINLYGKFGCSDDANFFFDRLVVPRDTISWTARIVNNCREERFDEVINDFKEMGRHGIRRNCFTFSSVLKACARINDGGICGKQVHANAIKLGVESETFVQCGLIDMYGKCGLLPYAEMVFEMIGDKQNTAYWTAMLVGYVRNGCSVDAIKLLYKIRAAGIKVRESLVNEVRIACGTEFDEKRIQ